MTELRQITSSFSWLNIHHKMFQMKLQVLNRSTRKSYAFFGMLGNY